MIASPAPPRSEPHASPARDTATRRLRTAGSIALLGLLFAAALGLRAWALNWGLPYAEHPDEPALLEIAVRMVRDGDPNPHSFIYPSLFFYLLAAVIRAHAQWGI